MCCRCARQQFFPAIAFPDDDRPIFDLFPDKEFPDLPWLPDHTAPWWDERWESETQRIVLANDKAILMYESERNALAREVNHDELVNLRAS